MNHKINLDLGYITWLIPLLLFLVFGVPELIHKWEVRKQKTEQVEEFENELEQLLVLKSLDKHQTRRIAFLNTMISNQKRAIRNENKIYLQTGGLLLLLLIMFVVMGVDGARMRSLKVNDPGWERMQEFSDPQYDEIANRISWSPAKSGGSTFVSHKIKQLSSSVLKVKGTSTLKIFGWTFLLVGLHYLIIEFYTEFLNGVLQTQGVLKTVQLFFKAGGPFFLIGLVFVLKFNVTSVFDKRRFHFKKGKHSISLSEIYAIQLITEFVEGNGGSSSSFYSHELNLVLHTGDRINIMDHGVKSHIQKDALQLGKFLNVPVWNRIAGGN